MGMLLKPFLNSFVFIWNILTFLSFFVLCYLLKYFFELRYMDLINFVGLTSWNWESFFVGLIQVYYYFIYKKLFYNGSRTEWSWNRSLIIRVRTKWDNCTAGVWFVIITSMIRGRFGRNEVLLQINHKNCNFCEIKISYLTGDLKPNLT